MCVFAVCVCVILVCMCTACVCVILLCMCTVCAVFPMSSMVQEERRINTPWMYVRQLNDLDLLPFCEMDITV